MLQKKTKIVCTLGPASDNPKTLEKMIRAGMNVARLNFSHGEYKNFEKTIKMIRDLSKKLDTPIAILQDLQGPKIRIGEMPKEGVAIKKNETVILSTGHDSYTTQKTTSIFPVQFKDLHKDVGPKDTILIDDGLIELTVEKITGTSIFCRVEADGTIKSHKGINVPTASLSADPLTPKDLKDLEFGIKHDVDYIALSFVRHPSDIIRLKKILASKKSKAKVMAKIERHEAVKNLEEIVKVSDALMVARGDLGVEIPAEQVPIVQKRMILLCNTYGKPVITATQMLNSMVENARATRAEISDAANAIFDHSDALMLSNETAVGKYPVEAVETLAKVARATEENLQKYEHLLPFKIRKFDIPVSNATCLNGTKLALDINADCIVAVSMSGYTAQHIAKHRIYKPIITFTTSEKVRNQLALVWGLNNIFVQKIDFKNAAKEIGKFLKKEGVVKKGEEIVIVINASKDENLISTTVV
ncbi:MAG: pyruvate kinase [Candidatus Gracilibacteria bacterium]